jgi:O-antigen/teichoic acid export membrane protein
MTKNIKNSVGVVCFKILSGLSTFYLYIALSHYLNPESLGKYELALSLIMLISCVFSLGYVPFVSGEFTRKNVDLVGISTNKINVSYFYTTLFISTLFVPVSYGFKSFLNFNNIELSVIFVTSILVFFKAMYASVLQHTFRPLKYSFFESCYPIIITMISVSYLYFSSAPKIEVLLASHLISLLFIASSYIRESYPKIEIFVNLNFGEFIGIIRSSFQWFVVSLISWIMYAADKWILEILLSTMHVGLYSQIFKLSSAYNLVVVSTIAIIFTPHIYKSFRTEEPKVSWFMINNQAKYLVILTIALLSLNYISGEWIYKSLVGELYHSAFQYSYMIICNFMLTAIVGYYGYVFVYFNRTKHILIALLLGTCINLLVSYLLTPELEIYGVLVGSFVSQICMLVYTITQAHRMLFKV